ncbi:MAG: filamentous hemagglutinin N-terminal domain-containing protein [Tolypothrix carrinoi HA7290-LM1]|jgi:hypothetical protein|nr:filamentous hemagglutinin N-terminal domain-containing protein [Tolypothrix carrinoi HA7290-LM1]
MFGLGITRLCRVLLGIAISAVSQTLAFCVNYANAQITPDGTLPNNSNIRLEAKTFNITGGTQAGSNLFHSFQQFSVPTGGTAFFNNAVDIQNIIGRLTSSPARKRTGIPEIAFRFFSFFEFPYMSAFPHCPAEGNLTPRLQVRC